MSRFTLSPPLRQHGFTLLELSLTLLIAAMLLGGVVIGKSMMEAAELRSVIVETEKYKSAMEAFKAKYSALPGDMANASSYWGLVDATPATCRITAGTGTQTCDGDGNGKISATAATDDWERDRFWQHLQNAQMLDTTANGRNYGGAYTLIGTNAPASKLSGGGYSVSFMSSTNNFGLIYTTGFTAAHYFLLGRQVTNSLNFSPVLGSDQALSIDMKNDDGLPASGAIISGRNSSTSGLTPNCNTTDVAATSRYNTAATGAQCVLLFRAD